MIRQVRKSWQTTSAFLSLKVYAFLKFTLDRFYNSYKEPTLSSWTVCQFPGFFAVLKATAIPSLSYRKVPATILLAQCKKRSQFYQIVFTKSI